MHKSKKFVTVLRGVQNGLYTSNMLPAQYTPYLEILLAVIETLELSENIISNFLMLLYA